MAMLTGKTEHGEVVHFDPLDVAWVQGHLSKPLVWRVILSAQQVVQAAVPSSA